MQGDMQSLLAPWGKREDQAREVGEGFATTARGIIYQETIFEATLACFDF
jgi:hypothetical protein